MINKPTVILLLSLLLSAVAGPAHAQLINDSMLKKAQNGEVSYVEGKFVAFLNDTVSPAFVKKEFAKLGYVLSYVDILPLKISIVNVPPDSTLERLSSHPSVLNYLDYKVEKDSAKIREELIGQGIQGDLLDQAVQRLLNSPPDRIICFEFDYNIDDRTLKEIMGSFRNVAYQLEYVPIKSVNVSVEPGTETEVMEVVEKLPFVESTALIGMLNDQ